ncbi:exonuclease domain-containing protein [Saxibacter everestensis]|uniref:Exonuclease domain-containing protein n=1 Tax=Saxibacter everestensis TaxID=2909229 RepID=A0ABY8QX92_9MICO|nr:exonuclease domain-containing protein [Brevibacteriaceae bacterium ZFBP1038]
MVRAETAGEAEPAPLTKVPLPLDGLGFTRRRSHWHRGALLAFDLETTGVDPARARIVTATMVKIRGGDPVGRHWIGETSEWLVNPGIEIPAEASAIHGVTTERARREGAAPRFVIESLLQCLADTAVRGEPVVGHNVCYDLTVLHAEAVRWGLIPPSSKEAGLGWVIDTLVVDKQLDRFRKGKRTLAHTAAHYEVPLVNAHNATADAVAAARVAVAMAEKYPALRDLSLEELHLSQIDWKQEQAKGLQEWLRSRDPRIVIDGRWPVAI